MKPQVTRPADRWSPLYFLASVGAGGLAVTFFMYLMFWVKHPGQPVPVFEDIQAALATASPLFSATIYLALAGIAVFAAMNLYLLVWNLRRTGPFLRSEGGAALAAGQGQTQMTALPLALAMSINGLFILGLVFVPGLWGVVEYLFPLALIAFAAVGVLALRQVGRYVVRVIGHGGFDWKANNSLSQLLPAFALSMVGVGLAAPAAMSTSKATAGIALVLASFFLVIAVIYAAVKLVLGVRSMLEHGVAVEQAPTLLIVVPMVTVLSILLVRLDHALHVHFGGHSTPADMLVFLTRALSVQVGFTLFGLTILSATGYIRRFITGSETSVGSYALICPGVALSVLMHFWINKGLVAAGMIAKFGTAYWALSAVALALQLSMIVLLVVLNRRHFLIRQTPAQVPAE
ncbi:TsoY family (seleno)protein [Pseudooceanicola sp. 200-1SW]|uniref:TsoY family (seleno)protein n=1 Tax=Pseudooceanicola sp. 200-1SW TaxID=3425949 RepID=UPI003D7FC598